jgi:hypothetical protein
MAFVPYAHIYVYTYLPPCYLVVPSPVAFLTLLPCHLVVPSLAALLTLLLWCMFCHSLVLLCLSWTSVVLNLLHFLSILVLRTMSAISLLQRQIHIYKEYRRGFYKYIVSFIKASNLFGFFTQHVKYLVQFLSLHLHHYFTTSFLHVD